MKMPSFCAVALAMAVSTVGNAAAPAAPTLTTGPEFKGLRFDWDTVPGATWYQLEYRAHKTGDFVQQGDDYPSTATSTRFSFPLHLYDWTYARYRLAACNADGCTRSAEISVSDLRKDAVGYFKSSAPVGQGHLGSSVDLTPDGYTMVAAAPYESSSYGSTAKGAVYVFRRASNGAWTQRARLNARTTRPNSYYSVDLRVSVSSNANTVAVFMPYETSGRTAGGNGEVDIYRLSNNVYTPTRAPRGSFIDIYEAELDDSGNILLERGVTNSGSFTVIYQWTSGAWVTKATIPTIDEGCSINRLSPDGKVLASVCGSGPSEYPQEYVRVLSGAGFSTRRDIFLDHPDLSDPHAYHDHNGFGIDRTGATIAVQTRDEAYDGDNHANVRVFHLNGDAYQLATTLLPGTWNVDWDTGEFGTTISISGDGQTLAVGHPEDYGTSGGVRAAPLLPGSVPTGGVYVYRLSSSWKLSNVVKPNYAHSSAPRLFGRVTAMSGTGKTLVVGVPGESSGARGIGGDWDDATRPGSGAVFMY